MNRTAQLRIRLAALVLGFFGMLPLGTEGAPAATALRIGSAQVSIASIPVVVAIQQKLFEAEGTTVTEWIRRRRLVHCTRELTDRRFVSEPISTIAARWGLVDASHFSKVFRTAYGMSPREFRVENAER